MIKVIKCNNKNYINKLNIFLEKRREEKSKDTKIVKKILKDVKKNKVKALIKYEIKFSKNRDIKPTNNKINNSDEKTIPISYSYFYST